MNRYKQALGKESIKVDGLDFELKVKHGDNIKFIEIQEKNEGSHKQMLSEFINFATEVINRDDRFDKASEDYKDLKLFVEMNSQEFFKEFMIAFRHTTREKYEAQEKRLTEGFQTSNTQ